MDRFKFGAWDKDINMISSIFTIGHVLSFYKKPYKDNDAPKWLKSYSEKMILMQCTGLKDKNGVLVFEGDIYEGYWKASRPDTGKYREVVKWDYDAAFNIGSNCHIMDEIEVIGNIYENPELLGEDND